MLQNNTDTKPNTEMAIKFLQEFKSEGPWVPTVIAVDKNGIETRTFYPKNVDLLKEWLNRHNRKSNIYFQVNTPMNDLTKKAKREDIKSVDWLYVDIDPISGQPLEAERGRILALLTGNLPKGIPAPTVIIFSGGGFQAFWKLENSIPINGDLALAEDAKRYNQQLEKVFGADNCHNVDRIMRLPGTLNIPDAKKIKKGRKEELARVVEFNPERIYGIESFEKYDDLSKAKDRKNSVDIGDKIEQIKNVDDLPVSDLIKRYIVQGRDPEDPNKNPSRSEYVYAVCCALVRANVTDGTIYSVITDPEFGISESILEEANPKEYAIRQIERAKSVIEDDQSFVTNEDGKILPIQANVILAINKLGVRLSYNEFSDRLYIDNLAEFGPFLSDAAITRLYLEIESRYAFKVGKDFFWMVAEDQSRRNKFHPVKDYLATLKWDGIPRVDNWLVTYAGAEDTEFNRAVGRIVLIAGIRRIMKPGCKYDEMLILEGKQGCGKSTALKILAINEEWFIDDLPLDRDSKKNIESLAGHWIVEAGELKGMRKGEIENLKSFLSRTTDKARMAYGRLTTIVPRQCIIIGTTNNDRYLKDSTGNRRFWPVKVKGFDLAALKRDVDQLWAEACHYEVQGVSIRLDPALYVVAHAEQEVRRVEDPFVEVLYEFLDGKTGKIAMQEIWMVLNISEDKRTQEHNNRIGAAMQELGWERDRLRFGGKPEYCYVKGTPEERRNKVKVHKKLPF